MSNRPDDATEDFDTRCRGTESCECPLCCAEDEDQYDDDTGRRCFHCGGDGWVQCDDPIQCTRPHNAYGECPCASCGGSGAAKDMTIW